MIDNVPTGYFSNSTGSSVNNCRFSPIIDVLITRVGKQPNFLWPMQWIFGVYARNMISKNKPMVSF